MNQLLTLKIRGRWLFFTGFLSGCVFYGFINTICGQKEQPRKTIADYQ